MSVIEKVLDVLDLWWYPNPLAGIDVVALAETNVDAFSVAQVMRTWHWSYRRARRVCEAGVRRGSLRRTVHKDGRVLYGIVRPGERKC